MAVLGPDPLFRGNQLTRGRKFSTAELQLMALHLLGAQPYHGYELIKAFGNLSNGFYVPSPGALYPALSQLEKAGLAVVEAVGKRRLYRISDLGRAFLDRNGAQATQLFAILKHAAKRMAWMAEAASDEAKAAETTGWLPEFVAARRALKAALLNCDDADHTEQLRVTSILQSATQAILAQGRR